MGETRGDHSIGIAINSGGEFIARHSPKSYTANTAQNPCIFKVPATLHRHSPKSYTPNSFSFGPLHHKKEHLKETEEIKRQYLDNLLSRKPTPHTTLEEFKSSILEVEGRARKCYAFPTDHLNKDEFVDMLVLDGCFIIELLRQNEIDMMKNDNFEDDPVFSVSWVCKDLYHDLILLENQIPWFILVRLFKMTSPMISDATSLTELALDFFGTIFSKRPLPIIEGNHKSNHILCLLRNTLVSSFETRKILKGDWQLLPSATSLRESGIIFKKSEFINFLDVTFAYKNGVLEMPPLLIQETTCGTLRNLISYEQCYPNCEAKITSYAVLLNNLITTTQDLKVLRDAGIIDNCLNPKDTIEFFKNIYADTYLKEFCYVKICRKVEKYTDRWWPRTRAAYVRNHFGDPWAIASQIGAVIVLILTLLQTWYTMKQSWEGKSKLPSPASPPHS